jgi:hypothetical protein
VFAATASEFSRTKDLDEVCHRADAAGVCGVIAAPAVRPGATVIEAAARTTVCMFGSRRPSDRSSERRSFGLSEADHSGILSGSRPMQQRLLCVEAGQTFSIQRVEVLTPQVSSIHRRLTRGRSLVRSQSGPPAAYLRRRGLLWVGWQAATLSRSCHINSRDTSRVTRGHHDTVCPGEIGLSEHCDIP